MTFIYDYGHNKTVLILFLLTEIDCFKINDNLAYTRLKLNTNTKVYEIEYYEEFLPEGAGLLNQTDLKILRLLIEGNDNEQIANELDLSEHTIKSYRKKMLKKTW